MAAAKKNKDVAGADSPAGNPAAQDAASASTDAKRKPIQTVRIGDVSASIWARDHQVRGAMRTFYSVTLERSFRDRDGAYRYTKSFDPDSLGTLVGVIQKADEYLRQLQESAAQ